MKHQSLGTYQARRAIYKYRGLGERPLREDDEVGTVELRIDLGKLARELGRRALHSKKGTATLCSGVIVVSVLDRQRAPQLTEAEIAAFQDGR